MSSDAVGDDRQGRAALELFSAPTREWFAGAFEAPTPVQELAWTTVAGGKDALVIAPTGSGKTLAAFLWSLDQLAGQGPSSDPARRCRVLYISPLKALAVDVERNLRAPLTGIRHAAARQGAQVPDITVGLRSGDTPADERRRLAAHPPDILITTPESLFLLLTAQARETLRGVQTVIVDEVHAVVGTKRGAHLAVSLERLDALLDEPARRIGLSATVRPREEVARFLCATREVVIVQPPAARQVELTVVVPVEDLGDLAASAPNGANAPSSVSDLVDGGIGDVDPLLEAAGPAPRASIWPHVEARIVDLVEQHRSTIVFANSRRLAERLTARLNEIAHGRQTGELLPYDSAPAEAIAQSGASRGAPVDIARAHHGSVSKEQRAIVEEELKAGRLPAVVATSSLELGVDMGAVDLVIQVEPPPSVASGLQRIGRAGHQVGATSTGVIFPKHRGELVPTAVVAERMRDGEIESLRYPRNPLDVLAQQVVAMVAIDEWDVEALYDLVRRAAPYASLPRSAYEAVLDMLSGRYPSDEFAELRPRLVWDRTDGTLRGRPGAQRLAVTSGGTIPDRGLFGVFLAGGDARGGRRVGELDEEMVYESRVGDVFTLGSTSWRVQDITHDRVLVVPAPGQPGRLPFWKGDAAGRPVELGRAIGAFTREIAGLDDAAIGARLAGVGFDPWAVGNLTAYLAEQRRATGRLPDDRTIVVERFRDELGDWRVVLHSPLGGRVHAPWALALGAQLRERFGVEVQAMHADDGIVLRIPDVGAWGDAGPDLSSAPDIAVTLEPDDVERIVTDELGGSALFAARFRECAARALLLPRRTPGRRSPLWQQRQRSAQLLSVASEYGSFPIILETVRECLQDVFDVPGLVELMRDIAARRIRVVEVDTDQPSPFARSLLFGYVAAFMYEGDNPLAERRAAALTLDSSLLAELLGEADLRELLDPAALDQVEAEAQWLTEDRRVRHVEDTADLLRLVGPITTADAVQRGAKPAWLVELESARRAIRVRITGEERWAAVEDAGRLRDALGVPLPIGVPEAFLAPVRDALGDLVARYARTHGPFLPGEVAQRLGTGVAPVDDTLVRLAASGRVVSGAFRAGTAAGGTEWCDAVVLRRLRRLSVAALRKEAEPVPPVAVGRFLPGWQHVGSRLSGVDGALRVIEQLQGARLPATTLERLVLPARVADYSPTMLDELTAAGEVLWAGNGSLPGNDGWIVLATADAAPLLLPAPVELADSPLHDAVLAALDGDAALFFRTLADRLASTDDGELAGALWDLVWAGWLTNDTFAPVRALVSGSSRNRATSRPARSRYGRPARPGLPSRTGPPSVAGRWSRTPSRDGDETRRAYALAETLLDRHGVLTRGAVQAEGVEGGFSGIYRVLSAFEEAGRARRGYVVEGLGAAQFSLPGAVDRIRAGIGRERPGDTPRTVVLAATDPANPYGAALGWPDRPSVDGVTSGGHRPGRKAGALVVLVDGALALYVERGGRSLLSWSDDDQIIQSAADALALAVREGALTGLRVERADGDQVAGSPLAHALEAAGFRATPRGLRLRA